MSTNRTALLTKLHKVLKKHYKPVSPPGDRSVLEHMIYACCLENARHESADEAFARLKELYFDWNEIRVTTVTELSEGMNGVPDAMAAAQRVKKSLQSVFEANYSFDMEAMKKQNLGKAEKDLEKILGTTPFVRAYVAQNALSGHSIPVSKGAIEVLYAIGAINDSEADKGLVPGLERAIPKNKGVEFGSLLQQLGADYYASPGSNKLKSILAEIDPNFKDRVVTRQARLEAEAVAAQAAAKERRQEARAAAIAAREAAAAEARHAAAKAAAKKDAGRKAAAEKQRAHAAAEAAREKAKEARPKPPEPAPKKAPAEKATKKPTAKGITKKKPR